MKSSRLLLKIKLKEIIRQRKISILFRTTLLSWGVILLTLTIYLLTNIPHQRALIFKSIQSLARVIATSIHQVTVTSILVEDYSTVIDHCIEIVNERSSVDYIVVTRKDGFSLVHTPAQWRHSNLDGFWRPENASENQGNFINSDLVNKRVFHYSHKIGYSTIDWGWIHIGLSDNQYIRDLRTFYIRTTLLAIISIIIGFFIAYLFARIYTRRITALNTITQRLATGDLSVRANIQTGDEIEELADSFNQMAEALQFNVDELEAHVIARTKDLENTNLKLTNEVGERKRAEDKILKSLQEKEVLLKEVHHRVKNNLQVISSLLYLQSKKIDDNTALNLFLESQTRVKSMALIHELLYRSSDFMNVDFVDYIKNLAHHLFQTYHVSENNVRLHNNVDNVSLTIETAIPCGLILNELITNALKHAFPKFSDGPQTAGEIHIHFLQNSEPTSNLVEYTLIVRDNGIGLPEHFDLNTTRTLGMQLVKGLTDQLGGNVELDTTMGTAFCISFSRTMEKENLVLKTERAILSNE